MALFASAGHRRRPFQSSEWMRRPLHTSRLVSFSKIYLLRSKWFVTADRGPRHCRVTAAQKLLINVFMAAAAVAGRKAANDGESVVFFTLLSFPRLMAIEAIDAFLRVLAHFVFMNNRILRARMALGAFSRSAYEVCSWLFSFDPGTRAVNEKC